MQKATRLRREEIEKKVHKEGSVRVQDLAALFKVTNETIRTDLQYLEKKGTLHRTHGGAMCHKGDYDIPFEIRESEYVFEKRQLARRALDFIRDGSLIYVDPTSTASYLGVLLKTKKNITIVTNSFGILPYYEDCGHLVIVTGGEYSFKGKRMGGNYASKIISCMHFDLCIMGMHGCKGCDGPANIASDEILIHEEVLKRSDKKILMGDPSKFEKVGNYQYAKFSDFDYFITGKLTPAQRAQANAKNIIEVELKEK